MFRIVINGKSQPHEPAGGRCCELLQHSITERMREAGIRYPFVRVVEFILRGANAPRRTAEDETD